MVKAIFIDYTGTMVRENEPYTQELLKRFVTHSDIHDPMEIFTKVWGIIKKQEAELYGDNFIMKDEQVDIILNYSVENYGLKDNLDELHEIWRNSWIHAPLFDDVKPFFENSKLPIYVVTNDDLKYVEQSMEEKGLKPAGIISAEMCRACKPHKEILEEGLRVAGVNPDEAILIGDSEASDVVCAQSVGVTPVLLDRKGKSKREDIQVIRSLADLELNGF